MRNFAVIITLWFMASCNRDLEPRYPVYHSYRKDYTVSVYFNKKLFDIEQKIFDSIARADTNRRY
jgi:hypothetical protein